MQIAVIADDGEVIDTVDVGRKELANALLGHVVNRVLIFDQLNTDPVRRFVGLPSGRRTG